MTVLVGLWHLIARGATRGGRPGARPLLAPERGVGGRMKRKTGEYQYHRNKKTNRVIVEIIL